MEEGKNIKLLNNDKQQSRDFVSTNTASISAIVKQLIRGKINYLDLIPKEKIIEKIIHLVLERRGLWRESPQLFDHLIREIEQFSTGHIRTVLFGGGTGLSSILGGETNSEHWASRPFSGLKKYFPSIRVVVCTTDDGGSSGKLLQYLPCIALGDIRRASLSAITPGNILKQYAEFCPDNLESLAGVLQRIINYRIATNHSKHLLKEINSLFQANWWNSVPKNLYIYLLNLWKFFKKNPLIKDLPLEEHCLGNLLLVSAIYRKALSREGSFCHPRHDDIIYAIQEFCKAIGAGEKTIYPASTTQGELQFLYEHGIISSGEHKSSLRHSTSAVQRVWVNFVSAPCTDSLLIKEIEHADLIILAPGSIYTSIIPLFHIAPLTEAVRRNKKALKILGAGFWAQRGETDICSRRDGKEYCVSDIIGAYHNNIPGGIRGLFHHVIVTDLQGVSGDIIRNYALEKKAPIYLDKQRVAQWGVEPIEAAVFSEERLRHGKVIQHDPEKFARTIKTLYVLKQYLKKPSRLLVSASAMKKKKKFIKSPKGMLNQYYSKALNLIDNMDIDRSVLRKLLKKIVWDNREIPLEHLHYFLGIRVVGASSWTRSTQWDNILGYYDPQSQYIIIHENLTKGPIPRLVEDILIAMGESLLGNYFLWKKVKPIPKDKSNIGKIFALQLRPASKRKCFLTNPQIKHYLKLAQLLPDKNNPGLFRMVINGNEAFTPPGLLFGLLYAWYLNNQFGGVIGYEMSLLQWKISELIPQQSMDRARKQRLIDFFRTAVFKQRIP